MTPREHGRAFTQHRRRCKSRDPYHRPCLWRESRRTASFNARDAAYRSRRSPGRRQRPKDDAWSLRQAKAPERARFRDRSARFVPAGFSVFGVAPIPDWAQNCAVLGKRLSPFRPHEAVDDGPAGTNFVRRKALACWMLTTARGSDPGKPMAIRASFLGRTEKNRANATGRKQ